MQSFTRALFAGMLVVLLTFGCTSKEEENRAASRQKAQFALRDLQGKTLRLEDLRGKVVLLNFFATWCGPCRMEIPEFIRLYKKLQGRGLEIVGVSLDMEGEAVLHPFVQRYGITYPVLLGTRQVVEDFGGVRSIPTSFLIDRNGAIAKRFVGMYPSHVLEASVVALLESAS